jgi:hypothetical protein
MEEYFDRNYLKEEEFLDGFGGCASAAAALLNGEWRPNYRCDDQTRRNQNYFKSSGELSRLVFESAASFHNVDGFSSVQIVLCSSTRKVTVRVRRTDSDLIAEKIVDRVETA